VDAFIRSSGEAPNGFRHRKVPKPRFAALHLLVD
jgi:hypothetical protein